MSRDPSTREKTPRRTRLLRWLERGLWTVAIVLSAAAASSWMEGKLYQLRPHELAVLPVVTAERGDDSSPHQDSTELTPGTPLARLLIPRLDVDLVVGEGVTPDVLRRGPGHIPRTGLPGGGGNVAIAGHRDTFFRPLREVRPGDLVVLDSRAGEEWYEVVWTRIVEPEEWSVVEGTDHPSLTLVTCYPFHYVGPAPQRFVVRAHLLPSGPPAAAAEGTVVAGGPVTLAPGDAPAAVPASHRESDPAATSASAPPAR